MFDTHDKPLPIEQQKKEHFVVETLKFTLLALIIILPIRFFVAQPFIVSGASMDPNFHDSQYLVVDQLSKQFKSQARGTVVVFRYPKDISKFYIKRIIGLPGETVEIKGSEVFIFNKENPNGFKLYEPYVYPDNKSYDDDFRITLMQNEYFVMGDNRRASSDSRAWGPLPAHDIVGTPIVRLLPIDQIGLYPADYSYLK